QDEPPFLRHPEILLSLGIRPQSRAILLVRREALERNQSPTDVVRPLIGQEVTHQVPAASRNDPPPILGILLKCIPLERINLVPIHTGNLPRSPLPGKERSGRGLERHTAVDFTAHHRNDISCCTATLRLRSKYGCRPASRSGRGRNRRR